MASKYYFVIELLRFALFFSPLPFSLRPNLAGGFRVCISTCKLRGIWTRWCGGGLGSPLAGFSQNTEINFMMISPNLLDICPIYLLVFSPLETADILMSF
jgi:hypothetical protein